MTSLTKQLEDTFGNLENFAPEKLDGLLAETMQLFRYIQGKMESSDPSDREEAAQVALELKEALEKQALSLCEAIGMDPAQLTAFAENHSNFTPEESLAIKRVAEELNQFKQEIGGDSEKIDAPKKKKKKQKTLWVHG